MSFLGKVIAKSINLSPADWVLEPNGVFRNIKERNWAFRLEADWAEMPLRVVRGSDLKLTETERWDVEEAYRHWKVDKLTPER